MTYDVNDMQKYEQELTEAAAMPLPDEGMWMLIHVSGWLAVCLAVDYWVPKPRPS